MLAQWLTWPSVFHIFGSIGVLWFFLWEWQAASSPEEDSRCSAEEKELLASTTSTSRVRSAVPPNNICADDLCPSCCSTRECNKPMRNAGPLLAV